MAFATIQITQGAIVGGSGESVLGLDTTTTVTLTDDGGAGATSYLWEVLSFPAPDASAPPITNGTSQVATIPAPGGTFTDGSYLIRLTRDDPVDGISVDVRWFAVANDDGLSLPSPGMNRTNSNVGGSTDAQEAGWFGSTLGSTNVLLDAYLRRLKTLAARQVVQAVAGVQSHDATTFQRVGSLVLDGSIHPAGVTYTFRALVETTANDVEVQLYNLTDGGVVAGSALSTSNTAPTLLTATVTLPSSEKVYEVQTRINPAGGPSDQVTCSYADIVAVWD